MKLKANWISLASSCSIKYKQVKKYIKEDLYNKYSNSIKYIKTTGFYLNRKAYFVYFLNMLFTGFVLEYILTHFNFLSLGLLSSIIMYYIKWLRKVFLAKSIKEIDNI